MADPKWCPRCGAYMPGQDRCPKCPARKMWPPLWVWALCWGVALIVWLRYG